MAFIKKLGFFGAPLLIMAAGASSVAGCEDLPAQCGLVCADDGVAEGNFAISGVKGVDAFFSSVVAVDVAATGVTANIQTELDAIALSLGLEKGTAAAEIKTALEAKILANVDGSLTVKFAPPKCEVSAKASIDATAKCDVSVDPGKVEAKCEGSCEAEVTATGEVTCEADATVKCTGTAPNFACEGTCEGTCELEAGGSCEGTCSGKCEGTCSVATDADGNCGGSCEGTCTGKCELKAAASCSGKCTGSCTYTPPEAKCEAGASAKCEAKAEANAKVSCTGKCEGTVEPPKASAECEASVKAEAEAKAECTPPALDVAFALKADVKGDATASAEFQAWLTGFKGHFAALLAANAKAEGVVSAAGGLAAAAGGAVEASINTALEGDLDLKASIGLACAIDELPNAVKVVEEASTSVAGALEGSVSIVAVVTGG